MKIAIEASLAQGAATGMGQYVLNLLRTLAELNTEHEFLLMHSSAKWTGPDFGKNFRPVSYYFFKQSLAIVFNLDRVLRKEQADVFHVTCTTGVPPNITVPVITTAHDLYPLVHPENCRPLHAWFFKQLIKWTARKTTHFITDSDFGAWELKQYLSIPPGMITTIKLAPAVEGMADNLPPAAERNGFLAVGAIEPRKKQLFLLEAYYNAYAKNKNIPDLVFVGPDRGNGARLEKMIEELKLAHKVKWLKFISSEELAGYYRSSALFLMPSSYEGFGIPVLEAMRYKLPVICSDIPVLHEVGGDYAVYAELEDVYAWSSLMLDFAQDGEKFKSSAVTAEDELKKYSWRDCAEKTLKIYEQTAVRKNGHHRNMFKG
ncbi:MAG: glycosyltransferase family 1 protein [Victivallaceae bacterium]